MHNIGKVRVDKGRAGERKPLRPEDGNPRRGHKLRMEGELPEAVAIRRVMIS